MCTTGWAPSTNILAFDRHQPGSRPRAGRRRIRASTLDAASHVFAAKEHAELESIAARIQNERRIYLIADKPDRGYETWLMGRLASQCPSEPLEQSFGYVWVARFECGKY